MAGPTRICLKGRDSSRAATCLRTIPERQVRDQIADVRRPGHDQNPATLHGLSRVPPGSHGGKKWEDPPEFDSPV
jgi:hypothetical protein